MAQKVIEGVEICDKGQNRCCPKYGQKPTKCPVKGMIWLGKNKISIFHILLRVLTKKTICCDQTDILLSEIISIQRGKNCAIFQSCLSQVWLKVKSMVFKVWHLSFDILDRWAEIVWLFQTFLITHYWTKIILNYYNESSHVEIWKASMSQGVFSIGR